MVLRPLNVRAPCVATIAALLLALSAGPARALPLVEKLDPALQELLRDPVGGLTPVRVVVSAEPGQRGNLLLALRLGGIQILTEPIAANTLSGPGSQP